jgi:indolepyruvate ferredoxin oxidoreductase alpha subunit
VFEELARSLGIRHVRVVDPLKEPALDAVIAEALDAGEPAVIITRRPCVLAAARQKKLQAAIEEQAGNE